MSKTNQNASSDASAIEALLDDKEVARLLLVSDGTPGNWRRANPPAGPPYVVVEGVIRYAPADLRSYLASRRREPGASEAP